MSKAKKFSLPQIRKYLLLLNNPSVDVAKRQIALTHLLVEVVDRMQEIAGKIFPEMASTNAVVGDLAETVNVLAAGGAGAQAGEGAAVMGGDGGGGQVVGGDDGGGDIDVGDVMSMATGGGGGGGGGGDGGGGGVGISSITYKVVSGPGMPAEAPAAPTNGAPAQVVSTTPTAPPPPPAAPSA